MTTRVNAVPEAPEPALAGILQPKCGCRRTKSPSGECRHCGDKELTLQRSALSGRSPSGIPPIVNRVLDSPGEPLSPGLRNFFGPRFGHDFSDIRVHNGPLAAASALSVDANAYTVGKHIVFGSGNHLPSSEKGRRLLAHELAHTIQQESGAGFARSAISQPQDSTELEANTAADAVMASQPPQLSSGHPPAVSREPAAEPGLLQKVKARFYQNLIDSMRIPQAAAIRLLRRAASHLPDSVRGVVDTIIDVIEFVTGIVIQLIEAIVALNVGVVSGLASLVEGLVRINIGLLHGMVLETTAAVTGDIRPLMKWLEGIYHAIVGIPAGLKALADAWLAEFKTASLDRQTIMIGELTGQIIALLLPLAVSGGTAGGAAATETASTAGTATELVTGASRVTSTGVRLTAISRGAGTAEAATEVATGASRVTSTGVRLSSVSELGEGVSTTAGATARGGGAASDIATAARGPSAVLSTEGSSALRPLEVPIPETPPPTVRLAPPLEAPAPVPATVPTGAKIATAVGTAAAKAPEIAAQPEPTEEPVPSECVKKAARLSTDQYTITATTQHSGGDPLADLFCEEKAGDPCEYRVRARGNLRYDAARFDAIRGRDVYECKCGYDSLLRRAQAGERWAQKALFEKMEQIRRQIRVAGDLGLNYRILVSSKQVAEYLRGELGSEVDVIQEDFQPCD